MSEKHPSLDITGSLSKTLEGKKIVLCISGSVAAVRASEIARLLMRHGADVYPVMSKAACGIIHPDLMHWATGNEAITEITGKVEHVALAGNVKGKADLLLVAPATANTVGKIACGIDDTPVTTFVTTGLGEGIPLIVVPAMHEPMYRHPFVKENIKKLEDNCIKVMMPRVEEGKAKIPDNKDILEEVINTLAPSGENKPLKGKRVLVTAGRTVEYIDPVRVISNNSSGKMGLAIAEAAMKAGAEVTLVAGKITVTPSSGIKVVDGETAEKMYNAVHSELRSKKYDVFASVAAVGDWQAVNPSSEKVSTHDRDTLTIELKPTPKIIDSIRDKYPDIFLLAFRALHDLSEKDLVENASWRMNKASADMIAVNDVSKSGAGFETDTNEMILLSREGESIKIPMAAKSEVAEKIIKVVSAKLQQ
jgi:phosphopantothenoylcysteine decarboxylase/phosphopantothenate--cysteine ligase